MTDFVRVAGLWKHQSHDGRTFLTGPLDPKRLKKALAQLDAQKPVRIAVFKNDRPRRSNHRDPDYWLHVHNYNGGHAAAASDEPPGDEFVA